MRTTNAYMKSLVNKTGIVSSVAKSDEIGKKAHLVWCEISRELLNQAFLFKKPGLVQDVVIWSLDFKEGTCVFQNRKLLNQTYA